MNSKTLESIIASITHSTPPELVVSLLPRLKAWDYTNWPLSNARTLANIHTPHVRADFQELFDFWQKECSEIPGIAIALAFEACLHMEEQHERTQVDLVWTGPETNAIPFRRTDQALIQLINSTKRELLIVSFAVYKIQPIAEAIQAAIQRGVKVNIVLEHPDESEGKITFPGEYALGKKVLQHSKLFVWPTNQRPVSNDGKFGSLHAKIALADNDLLFISSANLTEYAMNLNMEMGVLIQGGDLPVQVRQQFEELITQGILKQAT